jgi:sulfur-oxidizing protein SoxX
MKKTLFACAAAAALATATSADTVAPMDVAYGEYGEIEVSLSGTPGDIENGKSIMNKGAGNCIACHQVSDLAELPFHGEVGPSLDGVADRWSEAEIRGILANAKNVFPDTMMPAFYKTTGFIRVGNAYTGKAGTDPADPLLTAQEIEDVVAYLMTLKE